MKQVKFIAFGSNSALGGFGPGDTARVNDELAAHLVDDARVAVYADAAPAPAAAEAGKPAAGKGKARK